MCEGEGRLWPHPQGDTSSSTSVLKPRGLRTSFITLLKIRTPKELSLSHLLILLHSKLKLVNFKNIFDSFKIN